MRSSWNLAVDHFSSFGADLKEDTAFMSGELTTYEKVARDVRQEWTKRGA
jgi:hypothetical protein